MADPWSNTTPTNANTVKDIVPAELIALKQVNLDRPRQLGQGLSATIGYSFSGAGPYTSGPTAIKYNATQTWRGSYTTGSGEYQCNQAGWYKVEASLERLGSTNGLAVDVEGLVIQRWNGAVWSDVQQAQAPGKNLVSSTAAGSLYVAGVVNCAATDKLRVIHNLQAPTNLGAGNLTQTTSGELNFLYIEFLRTP